MSNKIAITVVKNIVQEMFQKQKLLQERLVKAHEVAITSVMSSSTTITNQRLDQLSENTKADRH